MPPLELRHTYRHSLSPRVASQEGNRAALLPDPIGIEALLPKSLHLPVRIATPWLNLSLGDGKIEGRRWDGQALACGRVLPFASVHHTLVEWNALAGGGGG